MPFGLPAPDRRDNARGRGALARAVGLVRQIRPQKPTGKALVAFAETMTLMRAGGPHDTQFPTMKT
jgi:hypothetical protein